MYMPKKLRIILLAIGLVIVAGIGYLLMAGGTDEPNVTTTDNSQQTSTPPPKTETAPAAESGKYLEYDAETVASTQGKRVLFFHAPWCPQCRQLEASIKAGAIPSDVTIFKVDYDSSQKLRQQYGVTIQTTLVLLDSSGNEAKKYVAYDQPSLSAVVKNLL